MLEDLGHPQPATSTQVNNTIAVGFSNHKLKQKRSKSVNMNYYWIQNCTDQKRSTSIGAQAQVILGITTQNTSHRLTT